MTELRQLDEVAYVRFASVYRSFQISRNSNAKLIRWASKAPKSGSLGKDRDQIF